MDSQVDTGSHKLTQAQKPHWLTQAHRLTQGHRLTQAQRLTQAHRLKQAHKQANDSHGHMLTRIASEAQTHRTDS